jgi:hypothetical protein
MNLRQAQLVLVRFGVLPSAAPGMQADMRSCLERLHLGSRLPPWCVWPLRLCQSPRCRYRNHFDLHWSNPKLTVFPASPA